MISVRVNEIDVENYLIFHIQALFDVIWHVFQERVILQKKSIAQAIWQNFCQIHRFETEGKK